MCVVAMRDQAEADLIIEFLGLECLKMKTSSTLAWLNRFIPIFLPGIVGKNL